MKRIIIVPIDGCENGRAVIDAVIKILTAEEYKEILDYVSHIKLNDAIHNFDIGGPKLLETIRKTLDKAGLQEVGIFLDLKIFDVSATVLNTLKKYVEYPPDILTVCARCSVEGINKLRSLLPGTKLAMISVPTDIDIEECRIRFEKSPSEIIINDLDGVERIHYFRLQGTEAVKNPPFDLIVSSGWELPNIQGAIMKAQRGYSYGFIVPGIRDEWMLDGDDHQKRIMGIKKALSLGATFVVLGAQMTKGNPKRQISAQESCRLTVMEIA